MTSATAASPTPPAPSDLEIARVLRVNISHITSDDHSALLETAAGNSGGYYCQCDPHGKSLFALVKLDDDVLPDAEMQGNYDYSDELMRLVYIARANGCDWLHLDDGASLIKELPTFSW